MFHGHKYKVTFLYFILVLSCSFGVDSDFQQFVSSQHSSTTTGNHRSESRPVTTTLSPANVQQQHLTNEENIRRELIKVQILQRLGLNEKPQVDLAHKISRDLVLETLRRTESLDSENTAGSPTSSLVNNAISKHAQHRNSSVDDGTANYAKTSEIISFPDTGPVLNGHTLLSFSYAGNHAYGVGVRIKKAHLWVKMDYRSSIGRHFGHLLHPKGINLYVFQGNFSHQSSHHTVHLNRQEISWDLVVSRTLSLDSLGWQKLDVTQVVQKWYGKLSRHRIRHGHHNNHRDKLTLLVDCSGCGYSIHPIIFSRDNSVISSENNSDGDDPDRSKEEDDSRQFYTSAESRDSGKGLNLPFTAGGRLRSPEFKKVDNLTEIPFLVMETESAPNFKRSRRRALECSPRVKHCCKQRFYISFRDLGWDDWIIAPRGYYANYCRGHCGGLHRTPDTFLNYHTHVIEEYRRTQAGQVNLSGITPCCAPTKFAPMSLIYFGPDLNIIKRDLPKMIVEECGCP